jgi:hypothetical protein
MRRRRRQGGAGVELENDEGDRYMAIMRFKYS